MSESDYMTDDQLRELACQIIDAKDTSTRKDLLLVMADALDVESRIREFSRKKSEQNAQTSRLLLPEGIVLTSPQKLLRVISE